MKKALIAVLLVLSGIRLAPHLALMLFGGGRSVVEKDLDRWAQALTGKKPADTMQRICFFVRLMTFKAEYRNLFYYRTGFIGKLLSVACRPMPTLFIDTPRIGAGLFIQHGFCTIIAAAEIGENCWINQQVTIGFSNATDLPTIQDNVTINAGAKVIGKVSVGKNSKVGANAVVVKDVPADVTVVGVPAYIVRKDGMRVNLPL